MTDVTVAIITDENDRILIARRKAGKVMAGCWEFPGGKVEADETTEEGLKRELKEEMNVELHVGSRIAEAIYPYEWGTVRLIAFEAFITDGEIELLDHDALDWAATDEMKHYGMTPADEPLIEAIEAWLMKRKNQHNG
jgi:8-oxo-dGTP diphosphatase